MLLAVWLPSFLLARRFWFVLDDAYITFRFSRNLALGHGPRYNLGDHTPVEGYSNFLWMLAGAGIEALKLNIELWSCVLSAACAAVLLWRVLRVVGDRLELGNTYAIAAGLFVGLHPSFAVYTSGGLETMAFTLLVFVAFEQLVLRRGGICPWCAGLACLGVALMRVEGLGWVLVLLALGGLSRWMAGERFAKTLATCAAVIAVGFAAYWLWRYTYYGLPLPNTAYAKSGLSSQFLTRGFNYVAINVLTCVTPLLAIPALWPALKKGRRALGLPIAAMAAAFYVYAILVGGDFMTMGRMLLPSWPFAALLMVWAARDVIQRAPERARTPVLAGVTAVALLVQILPAFDKQIIPSDSLRSFYFRHNRTAEFHQTEHAQWEQQRDAALYWGVIGRALNRWIEPDARVVRGAIGAIGYYSELFYYDIHGLVTHEVAAEGYSDQSMRSPGHDRVVSFEYFLDRSPDIIKINVVNGLPGEGRPEHMQRRAFTRWLHERWIAPLRAKNNYGGHYYTDFRPIPDWEHVGPNQYLVYWRRAESAEAALAPVAR